MGRTLKRAHSSAHTTTTDGTEHTNGTELPHPRNRHRPAGGVRLVALPEREQVAAVDQGRPVPEHVTYLGERDGLLGAGPLRRGLKRFTDIVGAAGALLMLAPLMVLIAVLVSVTSRGPVLFRQQRVGLGGETFEIFKFRTMKEDAESRRDDLVSLNEADGPVFKIKNDPRVTRVGCYLRRWSLDELPQFVNVLRGEMSLVGPRPPLPSEVETYNGWERQRLLAKPGLTCIWQVNGRSNVDFRSWVEMDLEYIANWRPGLDLELLAKTVPAVLKRDGAY